MGGDALTFDIFDSDVVGKNDDSLGTVIVQSDQFLESGFNGPLDIKNGKGTLTLRVRVSPAPKKKPVEDKKEDEPSKKQEPEVTDVKQEPEVTDVKQEPTGWWC